MNCETDKFLFTYLPMLLCSAEKGIKEKGVTILEKGVREKGVIMYDV